MIRVALLLLMAIPLAADDKPLQNGEPLTPNAEQKTFRLAAGYRIDLVAAEPEVIDPVAMCFDHTGAIYVCEMIGYPNGGVATGVETRGRVRKLTDENGDGRYEKSVVFADGLRFPTGVCCWRDGVIVANAPDIVFLRDTNSDGKADVKDVLYTGFDLKNIQQLPNSLQFHRDGFIHAMVGLGGGTITCPKKPGMPPLELRGRAIRFDPDTPGKIEPTSGGGQYGLTHDGMGHWFTSTNAQHLRQIVIPDHYLKRNPHFAAAAVTADIPEHGPAAKIFRISPFEAWRLERTARRKDDPATSKRLPATELVPGGYFTSACSPLYYRGSQFDERTVFVCDPANNLIHREKLHDTNGPLFVAKRIDEGKEFLTSTDNWFRPVFLCQGPDDALYVLDFYREAIETPLSLPEDMKNRMNLESRQRGRIWRIAKNENLPRKFAGTFKKDELRTVLSSRESTVWMRETAFRLLFETPRTEAFSFEKPSLDELQLLAARGLLDKDTLLIHGGMKYEDPRFWLLLEQFQEDGRSTSHYNLEAPAARERFQAWLSMGLDPTFRISARNLPSIKRDVADPWFAAAVLITMKSISPATVRMLVDEPGMPLAFLKQVGQVYESANRDDLSVMPLDLMAAAATNPRAAAALDGLAAGLRSTGGSLDAWWEKNPDAKAKAAALFAASEKQALDESLAPAKRVQAMRLLDLRPVAERMKLAAKLLAPTQPLEVQVAFVQSLAASTDAKVSPVLIATWPQATPGVRAAIEEALLARPERIKALLDAVEAKAIEPQQLGALKVDQLRNHRTKAIRDRAVKLFANAGNADRKKVIDDYQSALDLTADKVRGKAVFAKNCAACHQLEKVGHDVGANLTAALPNKTKAALLQDILDPSKEVDPRYVNYTAETQSGRTVSGVLAVETATSITLRRAEKAEDTILRGDLESFTASKKSLMPEDLEKSLTKQDAADLIEYLMSVGR